ncbi:hypothetical protein FBU59_007327 [Linderina macrospora]|uniref:Uncharacterized protein n=1 Tax=Linderina macrospora TaxID=4868 RepID=A0ACC1IXB1_9FUNG|nr:hypothetical protein FBU59_007327 [Linderina macrospora]
MMGGAFGGRNNPFQAYWYQGIVPGQGLPQIGMSAYGYGLPGLGLDDYLVPGAAILAGAGEGEIDDKDLDHLDEHIHGLDAIKGGGYEHDGHGDPDYPGHFKGEDGYDDKYNDDDDVPHHHYHHYHHNAASSLVPGGSQGVMAGMLCAVGLLVLV